MKKLWIVSMLIAIVIFMLFSTHRVNCWSQERQKIIKKQIIYLHKEVQEIKNIKLKKEKQRKAERLNQDKAIKRWARKKGKIKEIKNVKRVYGGRIKLAAKKFDLNPAIIGAVITIESGGNAKAKAPLGTDFGLMQLQKATAIDMGVRDVFHPYENIFGGARYLRMLIKIFGDENSALAAYNMGLGRVRKKLKKGFIPSNYEYSRKVQYLARFYI